MVFLDIPITAQHFLSDTVNAEAVAFAQKWLGKKLVTYQTDADGQLVSSILIEECTDIADELYLSAVVDRASQRVVFIASSEGGVNIEEVAKNSPEKVIYESIDPLTGAQPFQARKISKVLGLNQSQTKQFSKILPNLMKLFVDRDLSLLEINPLVITAGGNLHCLDAKINIDSNAIFRQPEIAAMHDPSQEDERESEAAKNGKVPLAMLTGATTTIFDVSRYSMNSSTPLLFPHQVTSLTVGHGTESEKNISLTIDLNFCDFYDGALLLDALVASITKN